MELQLHPLKTLDDADRRHACIMGLPGSGRSSFAVRIANMWKYDAILVLTSSSKATIWDGTVSPFVHSVFEEAHVSRLRCCIERAAEKNAVLLVVDDVAPHLLAYVAPLVAAAAYSITVIKPCESKYFPPWATQWWVSQSWDPELASLQACRPALDDRRMRALLSQMTRFTFVCTDAATYGRSRAHEALEVPLVIRKFVQSRNAMVCASQTHVLR